MQCCLETIVSLYANVYWLAHFAEVSLCLVYKYFLYYTNGNAPFKIIIAGISSTKT